MKTRKTRNKKKKVKDEKSQIPNKKKKEVEKLEKNPVKMSMENALGLHYFFSIALLLIVTIDHCECDQGSFHFLAER